MCLVYVFGEVHLRIFLAGCAFFEGEGKLIEGGVWVYSPGAFWIFLGRGVLLGL